MDDYEYLDPVEPEIERHSLKLVIAVVLCLLLVAFIAEPLDRAFHDQINKKAVWIAGHVRTPDPDWVWRVTKPVDPDSLSMQDGTVSIGKWTQTAPCRGDCGSNNENCVTVTIGEPEP